MTYPIPSQASISGLEEGFSRSGDAFVALVRSVAAKGATMDEADLERHVLKEGHEVLRQVIQDQLDRRSAEEASTPPPSIDPSLEMVARRSSRQLRTVFGDVRLSRITWKDADSPGVRPLDRDLNMPAARYSHVVTELVANEVIKGSFDQAVASLKRDGIDVPKRQAEELVVDIAAHFDAFYAGRTSAPAPTQRSLLAMSFDGKGIVMRYEDLRPDTKKKAEQRGPRGRSRLSPGEKPNQKRMTEVGAIWWQEPVPRTVEDIMGDVDGERRGDRPKMGKPAGKRLVASVERDIPTVVASVFDEADRRDPQRAHVWVALLDGNPEQVAAVRREAKKRGVKVELVLDIIHVSEYLWKAASTLFTDDKDGREEADRWVSHHLEQILRGCSGAVASSLSNKATRADKLREAQRTASQAREGVDNPTDASASPPASASEPDTTTASKRTLRTNRAAMSTPPGPEAAESTLRKRKGGGVVTEAACRALRNAARYLRNQRSMLRYDELLPTGSPIATGVIEGACRYLVKDRMGITGARWRLQRAEAVLRLRSIAASGDWDEYIRFYEQAENANNYDWHQSADGRVAA